MNRSFRRRKYLFLGIIAVLLTALIAGCGGSQSSLSNENKEKGESNGLDTSVTLRVLEAGGKSGEALKAAFLDPFTEKTGIKVETESPTSFGKLEAAVKSGQQLYDLVELSSTMVYQAESLGLLEPLDWNLINPEPINEEAKHPYGLGYQYYSTIMAWRSDATNLNSWADFWDVKKYPGKRALPNYPQYALPIALLADGVPLEELYPLDVDRAFNSLRKIAKDVSVWWESAAQPVQLLMDGEVDYAAVWSGRVAGNADGIKYTYNQGLLDLGFFVIPKGAKHVREAHALLHEMTVGENQAKMSEVIPYTGPHKEISSFLPKERLAIYPTSEENYKKQVLNDPKWWFENGKEVDRKWREFKMSLGK